MDPVLEQFVLEKSSPLSCELLTRHNSADFSSPISKMNTISPQTALRCSSILSNCQVSPGPYYSAMMHDPLASPTTVPHSPVENLPSISQFTSKSTPSFESSFTGPGVLEQRDADDMEKPDCQHYLDLNGNVQERYNTVVESPTYQEPEQDFEEEHFQTLAQGDNCFFSMSYYSADISCAMQSSSPTNMYDGSYYTGCYSSQASYDSDDSFEVEYIDRDIQNNLQRTQDFGQSFINTQHNSIVEKRSLPNFAVFAEGKKVPNRRGRPVTYNKPGYHFSDSDSIPSDEDERTAQSKGCRRGAKNILLWKFLLGELRKPNSHYIKWENEKLGIFKFIDTAQISRLWGQMKKKEDMNFEKLSRGIRHYYKDGLMSRRDGIRLVYKFNWDRVPRAFWPRIR